MTLFYLLTSHYTVCKFSYIQVYFTLHTHTLTHYTLTLMHTYTYTHPYTHTYTRTHLHILIDTLTYTRTVTYSHTLTHVHTYTYTHSYIHTLTHMCHLFWRQALMKYLQTKAWWKIIYKPWRHRNKYRYISLGRRNPHSISIQAAFSRYSAFQMLPEEIRKYTGEPNYLRGPAWETLWF